MNAAAAADLPLLPEFQGTTLPDGKNAAPIRFGGALSYAGAILGRCLGRFADRPDADSARWTFIQTAGLGWSEAQNYSSYKLQKDTGETKNRRSDIRAL